MLVYAVLLALASAVFAAQAPKFAKPAGAPDEVSANYVGKANGTLPKARTVSGKVFDRFTQIWLENTDFDVASTTTAFVELAKQGILLTQYYALTHPSEPNYVGAIGGDFFGMGDDEEYHIPTNISTVADLLEAKNVTWASYQENMPTDGYLGFNFTQPNYLNTSAPPYTYYVRKHNPHVVYDSITSVPSRLQRIRNFNDFAADLNASVIPQWNFVTPNLVNDAHDTDIDFASDWLQFWLVPLLANPAFNDNKTLIVLTFDENETYGINNRIYTLLLGGAVPQHLRGTTDATYYTHYSTLSTVENNWGLGSLGRGDTNQTMSNVFSFVANATGHKNLNISGPAIPLTNATADIPGPLNPEFYVPFTAPNVNASGTGGGPVFLAPGLNLSMQPSTLPPPVNLTALNEDVPSAGEGGTSSNSTASRAPSPSTTGANGNTSRASKSVAEVVRVSLWLFIVVFLLSS